MCSCKVLNTVIENIYTGIRNADFFSDSQFQYMHDDNEFYTCFVRHVFILTVCDDTVNVKVFSTFKHLSQRSRMD